MNTTDALVILLWYLIGDDRFMDAPLLDAAYAIVEACTILGIAMGEVDTVMAAPAPLLTEVTL